MGVSKNIGDIPFSPSTLSPYHPINPITLFMKQLLIYLIPLATLGIITLGVIYLSRRFSFFFSVDSVQPFYWTFGSLAVFMISGLLFFTNTTNHFLSFLYMAAAIIVGLMLYLLLSTLIVDVVRIFTSFSPQNYGLTIVMMTIIVSSYGIWNSWNIRTSHFDIPVKGLKENVRAVHLSDIHIGHFRGKHFMQDIVDKTKAAQPEMVFITGDLFDGRIRLNMEVIEPLKQIDVPIYFVEGNHDGYTNVEEIKHRLSTNGIHVLSNQKVEYKDIQIVGLNHIMADENTVDMHATAGGATIRSVLDTLPINNEQASIVLHHSPDGVEYANRAGIDLYLAGHTHAGQLFPINFIANWMFAYNRGLHDYKGTKMFVSEGIGTFGPPMRVGTKSEVVVLNLKRK